MSAALVGQQNTPQCLMDDLESTLYVMLWMAIVYSPCDDTKPIPDFLDNILDPIVKPGVDTVYLGKTGFLGTRVFFDKVKFVGRPAFDTLCRALAELFAGRYEHYKRYSPDRTVEQDAQNLADEANIANTEAAIKHLGQSALMATSTESLQAVLQAHPLYQCRTAMGRLENHEYIIQLLTDAIGISGTNGWITDTCAKKQEIPGVKSHVKTPSRRLKSDWKTSLFVAQLSPVSPSNLPIQSDGDYEMIDASDVGSDQGTVTNSPPKIAGLFDA